MSRDPNRLRILVVDDDIEMLRSAALMLSLEGYYVVTASSGVEATVLLTEHVFDVVITDLRMPIVDGHEIVRRTRCINPETALIVTSRYLDEETQSWLKADGILGLEKPINVHQLSDLLRDMPVVTKAHQAG